MKQFAVTAPSYSGEVKIVYGAANMLMAVDYAGAQLSIEQLEYFQKAIPAVYFESLFSKSFSNKLTVVEGAFEVSFDTWWHQYDKKINRKRCEPIWAKLSAADRVAAYYGIEAYNKFLKRDHWRPKADPEKYLKDRYWENEWK